MGMGNGGMWMNTGSVSHNYSIAGSGANGALDLKIGDKTFTFKFEAKGSGFDSANRAKAVIENLKRAQTSNPDAQFTVKSGALFYGEKKICDIQGLSVLANGKRINSDALVATLNNAKKPQISYQPNPYPGVAAMNPLNGVDAEANPVIDLDSIFPEETSSLTPSVTGITIADGKMTIHGANLTAGSSVKINIKDIDIPLDEAVWNGTSVTVAIPSGLPLTAETPVQVKITPAGEGATEIDCGNVTVTEDQPPTPATPAIDGNITHNADGSIAFTVKDPPADATKVSITLTSTAAGATPSTIEGTITNGAVSIPVQTPLLEDGDYTIAVTFKNASDTEVGTKIEGASVSIASATTPPTDATPPAPPVEKIITFDKDIPSGTETAITLEGVTGEIDPKKIMIVNDRSLMSLNSLANGNIKVEGNKIILKPFVMVKTGATIKYMGPADQTPKVELGKKGQGETIVNRQALDSSENDMSSISFSISNGKDLLESNGSVEQPFQINTNPNMNVHNYLVMPSVVGQQYEIKQGDNSISSGRADAGRIELPKTAGDYTININGKSIAIKIESRPDIYYQTTGNKSEAALKCGSASLAVYPGGQFHQKNKPSIVITFSAIQRADLIKQRLKGVASSEDLIIDGEVIKDKTRGIAICTYSPKAFGGKSKDEVLATLKQMVDIHRGKPVVSNEIIGVADGDKIAFTLNEIPQDANKARITYTPAGGTAQNIDVDIVEGKIALTKEQLDALKDVQPTITYFKDNYEDASRKGDPKTIKLTPPVVAQPAVQPQPKQETKQSASPAKHSHGQHHDSHRTDKKGDHKKKETKVKNFSLKQYNPTELKFTQKYLDIEAKDRKARSALPFEGAVQRISNKKK